MPSSFTAPIEDGTVTTLRDFTLRCARAFGATIHQHEDNLNDPLKMPEPDTDYYDRQIVSARRRLDTLLDLSLEGLEQEVERMNALQEQDRQATRQRFEVKRDRYAAMKAQVEAWVPPSGDHLEIKEFMLQQIHDSTVYSELPNDFLPWTLPEWYEIQYETAKRQLLYARQSRLDAIERAEENRQWITLLVASLPEEETTHA